MSIVMNTEFYTKKSRIGRGEDEMPLRCKDSKAKAK